jgi:hypothetical protein
MHLTQLYREIGRVPDAERLERELATELAFADPDHPIVRQLAELSKPSVNLSIKMAALP